jgi:anti-sigma regulatory factor (Ser/Thr protein kinase)
VLLVADVVARRGLADLVALPGVTRVGLALVEGGGRRLRFTASDRDGATVDWCLIDAYDDVPLNTVVRTGARLAGSWADLAGRYPEFVARQPAGPATGLVAEPLVVHGQLLGAVVAYVDDTAVSCRLPVDDLAHELRVAQAREARPDGLLAELAVPPDAQVAHCTVEGEPRAVGIARRFARRQLSEWGVDDDTVDTAMLCLSELVTNAVIHTGAQSEVRVLLEGDVLTVTVRDRGSAGGGYGAGSTESGVDDPLRVHGRGLQLVAALTSRWGSELDEVGTTVWFVLDGVLPDS